MQLGFAVQFILEHENLTSLSLITHSWGSMVAGRFAGERPALVDRLVLFAPIAQREPSRPARRPNGPAWRVISLEDQWARFIEDVPPGEPPVLSRVHFNDWAQRYLDSDPLSRSRDGELAYEPARVTAPVAILRGDWDRLVTDADARWLFDAFSRSAVKRDVKIGRGTHLMHLETMRAALWRESATFLLGDDVAAVPV